SQALFTAPHRVCPITRTSLAPTTLVAYSRLPRTSEFTTLPATRATNTSPMPTSRTVSTGTRESMHPRTTASGCCPAAVARMSCAESRRRGSPRRKRSFPSFAWRSTSAGVVACWLSRLTVSSFWVRVRAPETSTGSIIVVRSAQHTIESCPLGGRVVGMSKGDATEPRKMPSRVAAGGAHAGAPGDALPRDVSVGRRGKLHVALRRGRRRELRQPREHLHEGRAGRGAERSPGRRALTQSL